MRLLHLQRVRHAAALVARCDITPLPRSRLPALAVREQSLIHGRAHQTGHAELRAPAAM